MDKYEWMDDYLLVAGPVVCYAGLQAGVGLQALKDPLLHPL